MKLIIRGDDFGYTKTYNDGTIKAIEEGVLTCVDLMMDTPGTLDAIERIKNYPWISVGWHTHFWGKPVADAALVPSLINEAGRFKWRKDKALKKTAELQEIEIELRAELALCIQKLGRPFDTASISGHDEFSVIKRRICEEHGIPCNFFSEIDRLSGKIIPPDSPYEGLNVRKLGPDQYAGAYMYELESYHEYDPVGYMMEKIDPSWKETIMIAWHPGYLDDYILEESSLALSRVKDVSALCSKRLKNWIIENKIELSNQRDILYGTSEMQEHYQSVNSPLWIKK